MPRCTAALLLLTTVSCIAGDLAHEEDGELAFKATISAGLTNAVAAWTGSLSQVNGGDTVRLRNSSGAIVDSFTYPSSLASSDGVFMNRRPDGSPGSFVLHDTLSSSASGQARERQRVLIPGPLTATM